MSLAAGALSKTLIGQSTAILASAVATGGTGPYTYQWYRSQSTGFSPGVGNILTGQTALVLNDSGLVPSQTYFYVVVATDTGNSDVTVNSSQLTVVLQSAQTQNQFMQASVVGLVDMRVGPTNVVAAQVDVSVSTQIYPGQGVKIVANTKGGILKVAPISSKSDACIGMAIFNIKDIQYIAGQNLEIAMFGSVVWQYATGAITQFGEVCLDPSYVGGVQASGNSATLLGWAFDGAAGAGPIRVMLLPNASFATA